MSAMKRFRHTGLLLAMLFSNLPAADSISLGSAAGVPPTVVQMPVGFTNEHQIVAMQFDLGWPTGQAEPGDASAAGTTDHRVESREINSARRVVVYSPTNANMPDAVVVNVPLTLTASSPAGGPTLTISNIILTNKSGQKFTPTVNRTQLDAWRLARFTASEIANAAVVGDDRDPDDDGVSNLNEFLMGGDPKSSASPSPPLAGQTVRPVDGVKLMTLNFRAAKGVTGASLAAEASADLADWNSNGITLVPVAEDAATVEWQASIEVTGVRQFLRLAGKRQ